MIGSVFRLKSIKCDENQVWIIQMTLCSDDEHDLKQVLMYMNQLPSNHPLISSVYEDLGQLESLALKKETELSTDSSINETKKISGKWVRVVTIFSLL